MARSSPDNDNSAHRQLTLDEWAETLKAERAAAETSQPQPRAIAACASNGFARTRRAASEVRAKTVKAPGGHYPAATKLLEMPGALLTRTHLRQLGLERRAVDAIFRALPVVALPGYSRPMIRAEEYRELVERFTYRDDRVRPTTQAT
jgi:hypothetical protein